MITTGIFPDSLKICKKIFQFTRKENQQICQIIYQFLCFQQYRKYLFERIIHIQLQEYLNRNNLLAEQQYGFRPNYSTEYATVKLVDYLINKMDDHKIPVTILNFIDLSKAFDKLYPMTSCYIS